MTDANESYLLLLADLWGNKGESERILQEVKFEGSASLFLGVDQQGRRHVLAGITDDYVFKAEAGESVELTEWESPNGGRHLDLICHDDGLSKAFEEVVDAIVDRVSDGEAPHLAIQVTLKDMKNLLKPSRQLAEERARGLFGELVVLGWLADRNPHFAVESWEGWDDATHDFSTHAGDLEVKSSKTDARTVGISSLGQLDEIADKPLVLVRLHVVSASQGECLEDLVDRLVALGCNRAEIVTRLDKGGFRLGIDSDEHRFVAPSSALAWRVGPEFPGLRSTDIPEERWKPITWVQYTLDLLSAPGEMSPQELDSYMDGMMTA